MNAIDVIPRDLWRLYEVHDWRHAAVILSQDFPEEFRELCGALRAFRFTEEQITKEGGNESDIPKTFSALLRPLGWAEAKLEAQLVVDENVVSQDMEFPRFDGHTLTYSGECHHAENKEPVPCGIQGTDCCIVSYRAQRRRSGQGV